MKNITRIFSLSTALVCLLAAGCSKSKDNASTSGQATAGGPVEMKLKWAPGKQYVQEMSMSQSSDIVMPGAPKPMKQQTEITLGFSLSALKQLSEGGIELELKYISQKLSSKMDGREVLSFDSNDDPGKDKGNEMRLGLRRVIGAHVKYLVDAKGKVTTMENYQDFIDQLTAGANDQTKMMLKSMFSEWSLKEVGSSAKVFPNKPVRIGDTWNSNQEISDANMGTLKIAMKLKFARWEEHSDRHCMLLTYTGQLTSKAAPSSSAMSVSIDKGELKGQVWFDPAEGLVMESSGDQSMTIKMTMQQGDMTSKIKQKVGIRLVEISDVAK